MIKLFFNTILRTFKNTRYSFISIGGLTIGIAVVMLIVLWIHDELSFNKCHENHDRIAMVMLNNNANGEIYTGSVVTAGLGTLLKSSYGNNFERIAIVRSRVENRVITLGENKYTQNGYFMQSEGPEIFSLKMIYGSRDGLNDINSVLLSESLSKKLFGNLDPVAQFVKMDANWDLKVTGVYKDLPSTSEFREASFIAPLDRYMSGWLTLDNWKNQNMQIYVQLHKKADLEQVSANIKDIMKPYSDGVKNETFLYPMSRWHLYSQFENGVNVTSERLKYVWMYGIIGFFVLLLACINFINLCTSRSEKYAKEIGIRKTIGSGRHQLIRKFLGESLIMTAFAFALALGITYIIKPWFGEVTGKELLFPLGNPLYWLSCLAIIVITAILAGGYPAFYLSSFDPVKALRGGNGTNGFAALPRKVLVVFQFSVSISLIICTIIVNKQIEYAKDRPVGYTREGLISFRPGSPEFSGKSQLLRTELRRTGVVDEIATSNQPITNTLGNNGGFSWKGKAPSFDPTFNTINVSYEYGKTIGLQIINGRDFSREFTSDLAGVLINESALKLMGLKNPVGENLTARGPIFDQGTNNFTILGVFKDMVKGSPFEPAKPSIVFLTENDLSWLFIRINPMVSASAAIPKIEAVFNKIIPSAPFDYKFVDQEYDAKFSEEERVGKMAAFFTIFAIIISCLGLFGLATFLAEKRTKEIGIRKVNGAKVSEVLAMLNKDFVKWVAIAFVIATPIAYYTMHKWLENFAYKTTLNWWIFALAGLLALGIALLTVSWQSWKAATRNPVEALRYE